VSAPVRVLRWIPIENLPEKRWFESANSTILGSKIPRALQYEQGGREKMMRDELTRREDQAFLTAARTVVLTQFPNPQRTDCPGRSVLHAIATKRISMSHPAHEHVGTCSPCFSELTEIRQSQQHRR
jgi:hypothetical protein